ncbi:MAG TPA: M48 family metalloprotease, partial [Marinilabiliaceae bacterium]|nr:M48 family metalloprotease [Marinilabiliaceae bacterium]
MKHLFLAITLISTLVFTSCEGDKINIFTLSQDVEMGQEVVEQILDDPKTYPILDSLVHREAYAYLNKIKNKLLKTGEIRYAKQFAWKTYIIDQDVMNAFAVPGGSTFYYTGLLKYLDDEASLAGVMAHEFAHADKRHSTTVLTKKYGYETLLG